VATIWHELSHYESRDGVSELYKRAHDRELNATKAFAIVAAITQGREFFENAKGADDLVRPLMLFYGCVALARGVTLFATPAVGEEALRPAHGVVSLDWPGTLTSQASSLEDRIRRLPDLRIGFARGTFTELAKATDNTERVGGIAGTRPGSSGWRFTAHGQAEFAGSDELTLRDLLARLPDVSATYARTFNERSLCFRVNPKYNDAEHQTTFELLTPRYLGLPSQDEIREAFNLPPWVEITEQEEAGSIFQRGPSRTFVLTHPESLDYEALPWFTIDASTTNFGGPNTYIVSYKPGDVRLSTLLDLYLIGYIFGSIVRYHPSIWFALISRSKGDFMLPIIREATDVLEERFPRLSWEVLDYAGIPARPPQADSEDPSDSDD
jgi:hypothetical protein